MTCVADKGRAKVMKIQKILLTHIETECDGWDKFILDPDPARIDRLMESLRRVGQIYPLVLRSEKNWLFFVTGWARYLAMKKLGVLEAWARIYQKNELSDEEALWISVEEGCLGPHSPAKQRRILERFATLIGYSEKDLAERVAPAIGLDPTIEGVRKALCL